MKRLLIPLLAALLALPVYGAETDYIVKYKDGGVPFDVVSAEEMLRLRDAGLLAWYEPDMELELLDEPASAYYADDKWDLALINAEPAFRRGTLGQGVRVGVIDSGVNRVKYLADCLVDGGNYMDDGVAGDTADNYGHGTLVAALIAGSGADGCVGAATEAEIVPLKITDGKSVRLSAVCRAIYAGIDDHGCQILNLSLGIVKESEALREAADYAHEMGVVLVAAVGNNGNDAKLYPADYESVIGVGAVDRTGKLYDHSNRNESVFLTAPGVNVKTAGRIGGYVTASGTSYAVPYVTAAVAVMLGVDPALTPDEIAALLAETARDAGAEGYDEEYGYGILDLGAVVERLGEADDPCFFRDAQTLVNRTDAELDCLYLWAEYDGDGAFLGATLQALTLPPRGWVSIEPPESGCFAQFVCEAGTMKPLTAARKSLIP